MQCWLSDAAATTSTFLTIYPSQGKLCPAMKSLTSPVTHTQLLYEVWWLQSPRMDAEKHYSHVANCSSFPFPNLLQITQHFPQLFLFPGYFILLSIIITEVTSGFPLSRTNEITRPCSVRKLFPNFPRRQSTLFHEPSQMQQLLLHNF